MPIYEYECNACRQRFEKLQSFSDEPIRVCPHCAGETRRVLQPVGVIFKGSGWYVTDSRKKTSGGTSKPEAGSEPAGTSSSGDSAGSSSDAGSGSSAGSSDSAASSKAPASSGTDD